MSGSKLYFIAILLPEPGASEIRAFQQCAAEQFNSRHALRTPPHITLVPPFGMHAELYPELSEIVRKESATWQQSNIVLSGFGHFSDRVIYVDVTMQGDLVDRVGDLNRLLVETGYIREEKREFNPHVTIAHRDLTPEAFTPAYRYFQDQVFTASFDLTEICMLAHSGQKWQIREMIKIGEPS